MIAPDPFNPAAAPATYVPREATELALAEARAALEGNAPVVALLGPPGIGKTLLLRVLATRLPARFRTVHVPYPDLGAEDLMRWASNALGAHATGLLQPGRDAEGREACTLLLVDDAGSLPLGTAVRLGQLARGSRGRLRILLASLDDGRTREVLRALGLDVAVIRFDAGMSEEETASYLRARLERAGLDPALRARLEEALAPLHARSGGIPSALHREADSILRPELLPLSGAPFIGAATAQRPQATSDEEAPTSGAPAPHRSGDALPSSARRAARALRRAPAAGRGPALLAGLAAGCVLGWWLARVPAAPTGSTPPAPTPAAPASAAPASTPPVAAAPVPAPTTAAPPTYRVNVNARPWARIEIDGLPVGETPLGDLPLRKGRYAFRAHMPDGRVLERSVEVREDGQRVVFP